MSFASRFWMVVVAVVATACASASDKDTTRAQKPAREIVSGGARIRGGGIRMDVQVGRAFVQTPSDNGKTTATSGAVVTP
ncbi:MAG TPA: hypothetical protein VFQ53_30885 [Kofleriaceae bacterium]|nr:hypothetical protein [Kofleriaceae bacterium]